MPSPQKEGFNIAGSQTGIQDGAFNLSTAFSESSAISYEQIFSPLSIKKNLQGPTPGFQETFAASNSDGNFDNGHVGPTLREMNPYFPTIFGDDGEDFIENNDYIMMANETGGGTTEDINIRKLDNRRSIDTVRVVGLRGPLILSGWGFDIADRPVPKKGDTGDEVFQFKPDLVSNRSFWKTGPVHLMWDEERQVWAGGLQMVCGRLNGAISAPADIDNPTQFNVDVLRPKGAGVGQGSLVDTLGETITCTNRDASLAQDDVTDDAGVSVVWVVAVRINYEWIPLWVGCPETE
jgi:hypothetical protein